MPLSRRDALPSLLMTLCAAVALADTPAVQSPAALTYPATRAGDVVDDYFGRKVTDPYRWLEDLDSADTAAWVTAQNKVTFGYLDSLPQREAIRKRLTELWDYQRTGVPALEAEQLWFQQNSGLQRQAPLYRQAAPGASPSLVIDPNTLSPDGSVQMAQWSPSPDGRHLAYSLAAGGSDVQDARVRDLATSRPARISRASSATSSSAASNGRRTARDSSTRVSGARRPAPVLPTRWSSTRSGTTPSTVAHRTGSCSSGRWTRATASARN